MEVIRFARTEFPASVVRSRTIGEFVLSETRYGDRAVLPMHSHEYACVVIVLQGRFRERYDARVRDGAPGMVIVRPEGEPHGDHYAAEGGRCLNVEVPPQWLARVRDCAPVCDSSAAFTGGSFELAGRRLYEELTHPDDVSPLAVESLLLALFADAVRDTRCTAGTPPRWLLQARERIEAEATERLTLGELAAEAGVHPVHFAATFRRFFGMTVVSYMRRLRIEYACRAMAQSNSSLSEIALAAGFADQSHFGRAFKRAMGVTPAAYRGASYVK
jgi:AraC family transcriptional regulator